MQETCTICDSPFEVEQADLAFYDQVSPIIAGTKYAIPAPTRCPSCRYRQRLAFRNERYLYRNTCAVSGNTIVSAYSPEKSIKVCRRDEWINVDNREFGRDFDFSRPFFEQFEELFAQTYKANVIQNGEMENSDYTHFSGLLKNCYLTFDAGKAEDCYYDVSLGYSKDCIDCYWVLYSELCYESLKLENCYGVSFSSSCKNCNHSAFLLDCIGCSNCIGCANLRNKEYYVFNEAVGKERFQALWAEYFSGSYTALEELRSQSEAFWGKAPRRAVRMVNCNNCNGDELTSCENVFDSFYCEQSKDCRFCYDVGMNVTDCYDVCNYGEDMQFCYELSGCGGASGKTGMSRCIFSVYIFYGGYNAVYSMNCHDNSGDIFGCCDLRKGKFCVLNKQYPEKDYCDLVPRIIEHMRETGEWGQFFPMHISPFGYNETVASEFFPLEKNQAQALGANWSDYEAPAPNVKQHIDASDLPDNTADVTDDILETALRCSRTGKLFKLIPQELDFYRRNKLPLPRIHPEERHLLRIQMRNPRKLRTRLCDGCEQSVESPLSAESGLTVYCESCYQKVVN